LSSLYPEAYYRLNQYSHDPKRAAAYGLEHAQIMRRTGLGGNILDVGCGLGDFLMTFDDRWQRYGTEISEYAATQAAKKNIRMLALENVGQVEYFDVVVFRGTLQHIENPVGSLRQAYTALKPGGLLAILATPNTDSLCYKLFGTLPPLDPPRNWIPFGAKMLGNVLVNLGFRNIEFRYPYWGGPYASPLNNALRFASALLGHYRPFAWPGNMMECYATR
jgi:SAM-dependent methyltransferase